MCERFPGMPMEFINAGVNGYTSFHGYRYLKGLLLKCDPDCVITSFGNNDRIPYTYAPDKDIRVASQRHYTHTERLAKLGSV